MSNYEFSKLDPGEFHRIIPLMMDCFGMKVDVEYFKWKFLQNPAGSFTGFIAVEGETGEVAAYYGAIPEMYVIDGNTRKIFQSCDTMTHSRHRRKGLFQKLALQCYEYLRENNELFIIGLSGPQSTPGFIKFGWRKVFDFHNLFVPRVACYPALLRSYPKGCREIDDYSVIEPLIARTWIARNSLARIYSFRDLAHFTWRLGNPQRKFTTVGFEGMGDYEGYVVFHIQDQKLFLFDHVFRTPASGKALIILLKRTVIEGKLKGIIALCQENSYVDNELRESGFWINRFNKGPLHEKTPFIFYSDPDNMDRFMDPACWLVTSYDHDAS